MVAAVQHRDRWQSESLGRAVHELAGDDPARQLLAVFDVMDRWFNDPEYRGCMFMNAAAEFPLPTAQYMKRRLNSDARRGITVATWLYPPVPNLPRQRTSPTATRR